MAKITQAMANKKALEWAASKLNDDDLESIFAEEYTDHADDEKTLTILQNAAEYANKAIIGLTRFL